MRDQADRVVSHRLVACGVAFLIMLPVAILAGVLETTLAQLRWTPDLEDLLYGIDIHLLLAVAALILARLIFWRLGADAFPPAALGTLLFVELAAVGPYWLAVTPWAPRFATPAGKLFVLGSVVVGGLLAVGLGLFLVRGVRGTRWQRAAHTGAGTAGLVVIVALLLVNAGLASHARPRPLQVQLRADADERERPDLIIILVDTLRRDHLSFFGYPRPVSPNIDRLFAESFVFSNTYTPSNKTIPSIASLFTGLYPTSCGVRGPFTAVPADAPTLAEHLRGYGYRTGAFVANLIVTAQGGFAQGFDVYFPPGAPWWTHRRRTAVEQIAQRVARVPDAEFAFRINRAFLSWLDAPRADSDAPLFAYLHYMEPHSPYRPPPEMLREVAPNAPWGPAVPPLLHQYSDDTDCIDWECLPQAPRVPPEHREGMVARYDGEIRTLDRHLGRLFDQLRERGLLDRAHLLFLTDHGEQFGDHGGWYHGHSIYDELVLSPAAYRPPGGLREGTVIERPIAMLDLVRTLLLLADLDVPPLHQGREIPELLVSGGTDPLRDEEGGYPHRFARAVLSELPPQLYALRLGPWKLVRRGGVETPVWRLFHLASDPGEMRDLAAELPDTLELLRSYLLGTLSGLERQRLDLMETQLDQATLQQLRDLGYIE